MIKIEVPDGMPVYVRTAQSSSPVVVDVDVQPAKPDDPHPPVMRLEDLKPGDVMRRGGVDFTFVWIDGDGDCLFRYRYGVDSRLRYLFPCEVTDLLARGCIVTRDGKVISGWPVGSTPPARHPDDVAKIAELEAEVKAWKGATWVPGVPEYRPVDYPEALKCRLQKMHADYFLESTRADNAQKEVDELKAEVKQLKEAGTPVLDPDQVMATAKEIAWGLYEKTSQPKDDHWRSLYLAIGCAYEATDRSCDNVKPYLFDHDKL